MGIHTWSELALQFVGELVGQVISVEGGADGLGLEPTNPELRSQATLWGPGGISEQNQRRGCGDG